MNYRFIHSLTGASRVRPRKSAAQRGYSLVEVAFGVAIVAAVAVIAAVFIGDVNRSLNSSQALAQLNTLIASARQYRSTFAQGGLYTDISMSKLSDLGYATAGIDGTNALNVYGLSVSYAGKDTNKDATLKYATPTKKECDLIALSFKKGSDTYVSGIKAVTCSSTGELTLDID